MHQRIFAAALLVMFGCDLSDDDDPASGTEGATTTAASTSSTTGTNETSTTTTSTTDATTTSGSTTEDATTTTTTSETGETTGDPSTSSGTDTESTGTETGVAGDGDYGPCIGDDNECPAGTMCQRHGGPLSGSEWCSADCSADAGICPDGSSGTATSTCYAIGTMEICALECDTDITCPDDMECRSFGGSGGDAGLCAWPSF